MTAKYIILLQPMQNILLKCGQQNIMATYLVMCHRSTSRGCNVNTVLQWLLLLIK